MRFHHLERLARGDIDQQIAHGVAIVQPHGVEALAQGVAHTFHGYLFAVQINTELSKAVIECYAGHIPGWRVSRNHLACGVEVAESARLTVVQVHTKIFQAFVYFQRLATAVAVHGERLLLRHQRTVDKHIAVAAGTYRRQPQRTH